MDVGSQQTAATFGRSTFCRAAVRIRQRQRSSGDNAGTFALWGSRNGRAASGMAEFLDYYEQSPAFLCPFDVMLSVGSKLATSLSDRVRARMCPNVVHGYGATEGNPVAGAYVHQTAHIMDARVSSPRMTKKVCRRQRKIRPPGDGGSYPFSRRQVRQRLCRQSTGLGKILSRWMVLSRGHRRGDRLMALLIITGRSKNIIDLGGDKINPDVIERSCCPVPAFCMRSHLGAPMPSASSRSGPPSKHARKSILRPFARTARDAALRKSVPVRVSRLAAMPRNVGGKIDRDEVRRLLDSGLISRRISGLVADGSLRFSIRMHR